MIHAAIYGRLGADVKNINTKTGKPMAAASIAVNLPISKSEDTVTQWFSVLAFGKKAESLLRCQKGDLLGLSGRIQANNFTDRNGEDKTQLQLIADSIVSAQTVRSAGGRKKKPDDSRSQAKATQNYVDSGVFNDELTL